jgi:hypothetical protein
MYCGGRHWLRQLPIARGGGREGKALLRGKRRQLRVGAHRAMVMSAAAGAAMVAAPGLQNLDKRTSRGGGEGVLRVLGIEAARKGHRR